MKGAYTVTSSSASVTYGNIACIIKEMILSKFDPSFFTYVNISSELPFRNIRRQFTKEPTQEMSKRVKPYITIRPSYEVPNSDMFMRDIPLTKNFDNMEYGLDKRFLQTVMVDEERGYALRYKMNRNRIDFDVTISLANLHQMIDIRHTLDNMMVWDRPFSHVGALEALIPRHIIRYYSQLLDMDIDNPDTNMIPILLRRINQFSKYPINYKMKNASSRDEFFMYYTHQLIVNLSDLTPSTGSKTGMIDDNFEVSFHGWVEFILPGLFILEDFGAAKQQQVNVILSSTGEHPSDPVDEMPIFTMTNFYSEYPPMKDGMVFYTSSIFRTDKYLGTTKDFLNMTELFTDQEIEVIKRNSKFRQNLDRLFHIYVLKDGLALKENHDYFINWSMVGIIFNTIDKTSTYRLVIYADREKLNDEISVNGYDHKTEIPDITHDNINERVWGNLLSTLIDRQPKYREFYDNTTIHLLWYDGEEIYGILNNINIEANQEINDLSVFD